MRSQSKSGGPALMSGFNGPPAPRPPIADLALNQDDGIPLLAERYNVLDSAGRKLFTVGRAKAIEGIALGAFIPVGRTCAKYMRVASAADPARSERYLAPKTYIGPVFPGYGAPANYAHNDRMCKALGSEVKKEASCPPS
jgi:hypothetical protein